MSFHYKYPINYAPGEAGDTTAFAVKQLIKERNYMYQILNNIITGYRIIIKRDNVIIKRDNVVISAFR